MKNIWERIACKYRTRETIIQLLIALLSNALCFSSVTQGKNIAKMDSKKLPEAKLTVALYENT